MTNVFDYTRLKAERLQRMGRVRTSEAYLSALQSFMKFTDGRKVCFNEMDSDLMEQYEAYLRDCRLCRNSSSFYMRNLRCIYNMAVADGLARQSSPFRTVYTGVDHTVKRALTLRQLRTIREVDLAAHPSWAYARDMFLMSFYLRGMSFIDMAYLRRCDLRNGFVTYCRRKTGQQLTIRWERAMQDILDRYDNPNTRYLMPIILREDGSERRQYLNKLLYVNRKLKFVGRAAHIASPLTMYCARHSWASVAHGKNVPVSVISEAMGHESEATTRIYLASLQSSVIDEANRRIIRELL